jgi:hypothetical protein
MNVKVIYSAAKRPQIQSLHVGGISSCYLMDVCGAQSNSGRYPAFSVVTVMQLEVYVNVADFAV